MYGKLVILLFVVVWNFYFSLSEGVDTYAYDNRDIENSDLKTEQESIELGSGEIIFEDNANYSEKPEESQQYASIKENYGDDEFNRNHESKGLHSNGLAYFRKNQIHRSGHTGRTSSNSNHGWEKKDEFLEELKPRMKDSLLYSNHYSDTRHMNFHNEENLQYFGRNYPTDIKPKSHHYQDVDVVGLKHHTVHCPVYHPIHLPVHHLNYYPMHHQLHHAYGHGDLHNHNVCGKGMPLLIKVKAECPHNQFKNRLLHKFLSTRKIDSHGHTEFPYHTPTSSYLSPGHIISSTY